MRKIAEKLFAARIVAEILDGAAAVSKGMGALELGIGGVRKAAQKEWPNGGIPVEIDQLFMRLDGVRQQRLRSGKRERQQ